mmetsp:Transcript_52515/g.59679  ORF Transcript_52515/g.59679 Transcript_52515/m.59679 type:complete len:173 (+) Transcript_52515:373-891(+)
MRMLTMCTSEFNFFSTCYFCMRVQNFFVCMSNVFDACCFLRMPNIPTHAITITGTTTGTTTTTTTTTTTKNKESSHQVSSTTTSSATPQEQLHHSFRSPAVDDVTVEVDVSAAQPQQVESLIDQLADFKSFGASLMTSTTNSLTVGVATGVGVGAGVASEPLTASAGSGSGS